MGRDTTPKAAQELAGILQQCCQALARGLKLLREKKREDDIIEACEEVRRLSTQADEVYRAGLVRLYEGAGARARESGPGDGLEPLLGVIKWHEVFDKLDEATTRCSHSALNIETVVSGRA